MKWRDPPPAPKYRDGTCATCGQRIMFDGVRALPHTLPTRSAAYGVRGVIAEVCSGSSFRRR